MRSIPEQRIAEFQEQDYQLYFGISKLEFDRMLKALHEAYRQELSARPALPRSP